MKTKRIKRVIAGLLAFAVVLTGGSFGNVKSAKAASTKTSGTFTLQIPVGYGNLGEAQGILSAECLAFDYESSQFNIEFSSRYTNANGYAGYQFDYEVIGDGTTAGNNKSWSAFSDYMHEYFLSNAFYNEGTNATYSGFKFNNGYEFYKMDTKGWLGTPFNTDKSPTFEVKSHKISDVATKHVLVFADINEMDFNMNVKGPFQYADSNYFNHQRVIGYCGYGTYR